METGTQLQGAGETRLPAYSAEVPPGSIFQLIAAWLLLAEGGIGLVFLPIIVFSTKTNVAPGKISGFAAGCVLCLGAGVLLYSRWSWSIADLAVGTAAYLVSSRGLTAESEGYVAAGFAAIEIVFLVLGRRAAGKPEAMALASANIPFRVKVAVVWLAIFFMLAVALVLFQLDTTWIKENALYIARGVKFTVYLAVFAIVLAVILALFGALGRLSKNPVAYGLTGFYTSFFRGTPSTWRSRRSDRASGVSRSSTSSRSRRSRRASSDSG